MTDDISQHSILSKEEIHSFVTQQIPKFSSAQQLVTFIDPSEKFCMITVAHMPEKKILLVDVLNGLGKMTSEAYFARFRHLKIQHTVVVEETIYTQKVVDAILCKIKEYLPMNMQGFPVSHNIARRRTDIELLKKVMSENRLSSLATTSEDFKLLCTSMAMLRQTKEEKITVFRAHPKALLVEGLATAVQALIDVQEKLDALGEKEIGPFSVFHKEWVDSFVECKVDQDDIDQVWTYFDPRPNISLVTIIQTKSKKQIVWNVQSGFPDKEQENALFILLQRYLSECAVPKGTKHTVLLEVNFSGFEAATGIMNVIKEILPDCDIKMCMQNVANTTNGIHFVRDTLKANTLKTWMVQEKIDEVKQAMASLHEISKQCANSMHATKKPLTSIVHSMGKLLLVMLSSQMEQIEFTTKK